MSDLRQDPTIEVALAIGVGVDAANGYSPIQASVHAKGGSIIASSIGAPAAPLVAQLGTLGATAASYFVVAKDAFGGLTLPSAAGAIANGNAVPSGQNPVQIAIPYVPGAQSFDVLKADTAHSIMLSVPAAGRGQQTLCYDTGQPSQAYVTPTNDGTGQIIADNNISCTGQPGAIQGRQFWGLRQNVPAAAGVTLDPTLGETKRILLSATAITALTVSPGSRGQMLRVEVIQDGTGGRTIPTTWTNVKFPGGVYAATATASKRDLILLVWDDVDAVWCASVALNL